MIPSPELFHNGAQIVLAGLDLLAAGVGNEHIEQEQHDPAGCGRPDDPPKLVKFAKCFFDAQFRSLFPC